MGQRSRYILHALDDAANFGKRSYAVAAHVLGYTIQNVHRCRRVGEIGSAYLHGSGACHDKLQRGIGTVNAANAYYRNLDCVCRLPDHA